MVKVVLHTCMHADEPELEVGHRQCGPVYQPPNIDNVSLQVHVGIFRGS